MATFQLPLPEGGAKRKPRKRVIFPRFRPVAPKPTPSIPAKPIDPWADAMGRAKALSQPYLDALTAQQKAEIAQAQAASVNRGKDLNTFYEQQAPIMNKNYDQAIGSNLAIENAVQKSLTGEGATAGTDLRKQLEQMGAPGTEGDLAKLAQTYQGAGGAEFATGTSDVQNLVSDKAGAQEWLVKQKAIDYAQNERDLSTAIGQIAKEYGVKKTDVLANFPEQVASIWQELNAQSESKRDFGEQKSEFDQTLGEQRKQAIQDRADARHKLYIETKLANQATMSDAAYKVWAKKEESRQKALDRQARKEMNDADNLTSTYNSTSDYKLTGPSSQKYITVPDQNGNPTTITNPNYVPPKKAGTNSSSADTVDTAGSAKRQRAYDKALASVFNKDSNRVRDQVANANDPDMKALKLINSALKGMGVDPYSKAGNQIRQSIWGFLDGKKAGTGVFEDPRKSNPAFKKKTKKKK